MDTITAKTAPPPQTARDRFAADLAKVNVVLPVRIDTTCQASLVDATGREVLTVDSSGRRPDAEAWKLAHWVVLALNTCGGFRPET